MWPEGGSGRNSRNLGTDPFNVDVVRRLLYHHVSHLSDNGQQGVEPVECVVVLGEVLRELGQEQPEGPFTNDVHRGWEESVILLLTVLTRRLH